MEAVGRGEEVHALLAIAATHFGRKRRSIPTAIAVATDAGVAAVIARVAQERSSSNVRGIEGGGARGRHTGKLALNGCRIHQSNAFGGGACRWGLLLLLMMRECSAAQHVLQGRVRRRDGGANMSGGDAGSVIGFPEERGGSINRVEMVYVILFQSMGVGKDGCDQSRRFQDGLESSCLKSRPRMGWWWLLPWGWV
eukprot:evm.model.NODE_21442_length_9164_cov_35.499783.3